jgi:hypothetical protein
MNTRLRRRILTVVVLAAIAVSLALVGSVLGVHGAVVGDEPSGEVSIDSSGVTVSDTGSEVRVIKNLTAREAVTVRNTGSRIIVTTDDRGPLTADERRRAVRIARSDAAIIGARASTDYEVSVEPVQKPVTLNASRAEAVTVEGLNGSEDTESVQYEVTVKNFSIEEAEDSVTVYNEGDGVQYLDDEASVRFVDPETGDPVYWVRVNLSTGTVTDITDWADIRE